MTLREDDLQRLVAGLRRRLEAGSRTYSDSSFRRPALELVDELQAEVTDIAGWGWILWLRLDRFRAAVERLGNLEVEMADRSVRVRTWVRGSDADIRDGLLGWISVELGPLLIDNISLRRMADGRLGLSFPSRTSKCGKKHSIVRPVDDAARREVEAEILGQLGQREDAASELEADDA